MSLLPNAERLEQDLAFPAGVVGDPPSAVRLLVIPQGLAYNTEIFEANGWDPPTSWEDMYDPKYAECVIPVSPESGILYIPMRSEEHTSELQSLMRISYA